jgi:Uma2 family endonuclease
MSAMVLIKRRTRAHSNSSTASEPETVASSGGHTHPRGLHSEPVTDEARVGGEEAATPEERPAEVLPAPIATDESDAPGLPRLTTLRDVYDSLIGRTKMRAEIINGRLIVSPVGTPEHQELSFILSMALREPAARRGWKTYPGLDVCMDGSRDPYEPDCVVAPPGAPRWGERELFLSGLILVGEVVSPGSAEDDWEHKLDIYARGGVPLYLIVDPLDRPATVAVFSEPKDGQYTVSASVPAGHRLHLPEPLDFTFDTSILLEALPPQ